MKSVNEILNGALGFGEFEGEEYSAYDKIMDIIEPKKVKESTITYEKKALADMSRDELRAECKAKGLKIAGKKDELIARLNGTEQVNEPVVEIKEEVKAEIKEEIKEVNQMDKVRELLATVKAKFNSQKTNLANFNKLAKDDAEDKNTGMKESERDKCFEALDEYRQEARECFEIANKSTIKNVSDEICNTIKNHTENVVHVATEYLKLQQIKGGYYDSEKNNLDGMEVTEILEDLAENIIYKAKVTYNRALSRIESAYQNEYKKEEGLSFYECVVEHFKSEGKENLTSLFVDMYLEDMQLTSISEVKSFFMKVRNKAINLDKGLAIQSGKWTPAFDIEMSEKQMELVNRFTADMRVLRPTWRSKYIIDNRYLASYFIESCGEFIRANKAPSEKQMNMVNQIAKRLNIQVPANITCKGASEFIEKYNKIPSNQQAKMYVNMMCNIGAWRRTEIKIDEKIADIVTNRDRFELSNEISMLQRISTAYTLLRAKTKMNHAELVGTLTELSNEALAELENKLLEVETKLVYNSTHDNEKIDF